MSDTPVRADEQKEVEERQRPRSAVIFETIRREGEDEYGRASSSLFLRRRGGRFRAHHRRLGRSDVRAWRGVLSWGDVVAFVIPTFLGNSIGGVAFVAAVTTAEIASERKELGRVVRTTDAARGSATSREHKRHPKTPRKPR